MMSPTSNRVCKQLITCDTATHFESKPKTTSDRVCTKLRQCVVSPPRDCCKETANAQYWASLPFGFKDDAHSTAMDKWCEANCNAATPNCPADTCTCGSEGSEYESKSPGPSSDRECTQCSQLPACPAGQAVGCGPSSSKGVPS